MLTHLLFGIEPCVATLALEFIASTLFVLLFSVKLSKHADRLQKLTDISEVWIGMILLAFVTSLPELVNSVGATFIDGALNMGVGDLLGSNMCNVMIIVILDAVYRKGPILLNIKNNQVPVVVGGIMLMAMVGIAIGFHHFCPASDVTALGAGGVSVLIFAAYLTLSWVVAGLEQQPDHETSIESGAATQKSREFRATVLRLAVYSTALVLSSIWLLRICDTMARHTFHIAGREFALGHTVTGAFLLAISTSFPELFVSLATLRLGRINMAVAQVFGANMVNMPTVHIMHIFVRNSTFYSDVAASSLVMLFAAMLMSTIFILGLFVRSKKSVLGLGYTSILILLGYVCAALLVFRMSAAG